MKRLLVSVSLCLVAFAATAQPQPVPTPEEFLGYGMGERFTPHQRILDYFGELAKRSSLLTVQKIGESYEGRPLTLATITSPENHALLEAIRRDSLALASGSADVAAIAKSRPAVVWLAFGVHGNESSSAEAAMFVASALLRDPQFTALLDGLVVIIDPLENPDGRERYIEWYRRTRGVKADSNPDSFEHMEPWPGGRYNHYLIDMNRDWAWASQKETRARVAAYREWMPQVFVDFHEMSSQATYFFPPGAKPINANLPPAVEEWMEVFGKANAAEFSKQGWPFFVSEHFDLFYPGYGDSWPALHGAIGMTYEMAGGGRGGLMVERRDGSVLTLTDRVRRHTTAGLATIRTAAANREGLLRYSYDAARAQIDGGKNTFLIVPGSPDFDALIAHLREQGVEVGALAAATSIRATRIDRDVTETRSFPAGTAVISTRQARGALANTLLERSPSLGRSFIDEQRQKADADEPDDFYDITTWSLPLAMNVEGWVTTAAVPGVAGYVKAAPRAFAPASYGYLVDGLDPAIYRFAGRLMEEKVNFSVVSTDVTIGTQPHARGSLVILKGNNPGDLEPRLRKLAGETAVSVIPLQSGWAGGTALGSDKIRHVEASKIGLVGGPGSDPTSFGMIWHTLDVDTPIPHSTLSAESLRNLDLDDYDVLVFPDGNFADRLGSRGVERVKRWANDGGTVVAIAGGSSFLRDKDVEMSKLKPWEAPKKKDDERPKGDERYNDFRIPGSAFRTVMNARSYLTFGVPAPPAVLVEGTRAWLPLEHKVDNILTIDAKDPLISGVAWDESLARIKGSVYVAAEPFGKGQVITFANEPNFRLFWRATLPIFLNSVLYSPSFPR